jgi:hypothetical protein
MLKVKQLISHKYTGNKKSDFIIVLGDENFTIEQQISKNDFQIILDYSKQKNLLVAKESQLISHGIKISNTIKNEK